MNFEQARDEICAVVLAVAPQGIKIIWPDVPGDVPTTEVPWLRVTLRTATGRQSSLSGETGSRRFSASGTLFVECMYPMGEGATSGVQLAQAIVNAYRDARGTVWFRNARMREMGAQGAFCRVDVLVDYIFDDVR